MTNSAFDSSACERAPSFPVVVIVFSGFFGFILAELEGWKDLDGFYYVTSMLCGMPTPLTDVTPDSDQGKFVDIVIAIWSWALIGTVIGVIGSMSVVSQFVQVAENSAIKAGRRVVVAMKKKRTNGGDDIRVIHPTEEGEAEEDERDNLKRDNPEDVVSTAGRAQDEMAAAMMAKRIAGLESLLSKQTRMLEILVAASSNTA